ncbi:alpha/beta hydrolase [Nitrosomonas mobilis]|uniref:Putative Lysophospholipase n=1 Tax=Nitrosomonas mobilis TaxID=51642 RepID=A0A1G5SFS2_9PROT|nr:alpha/beta fold hydrolase [Nitrosomonas mobilis]SCZ85710.1 putative Lysophospholipase [Nitrosomonas mobilis]
MKQRRYKGIIEILLGIVVGGLLLLNVLAYQHAYAFLHFSTSDAVPGKYDTTSISGKLALLLQGQSISRPQPSTNPTSVHPDCRNQIITISTQLDLGAWYCAGSSNKLIILFHGYAMEKSALINEAKALLAIGHAVLLVDFRGSGTSSAAYTTIGYVEAEDVAASVRYVREHYAYKKIILYGQSMGAAAIFRAVDQLGIAPDALIVESIFDSLFNTVINRFDNLGVPYFPSAFLLLFWGGVQADFNAFTHNPVDYAQAIACPVLFLHGEQDSKARLPMTMRVYNTVPVQQKKIVVFPEARHESLYRHHPTLWQSTVLSFLARI